MPEDLPTPEKSIKQIEREQEKKKLAEKNWTIRKFRMVQLMIFNRYYQSDFDKLMEKTKKK